MKTRIKNLSLLLFLLTLPMLGQAQFTFTTNSGAITITGYNTAAGLNVVIPAMTNGYPVTSIGTNAFYFLTAITNVTIPNSVTSIGDLAFENCYDLTSVTIPNGVTNIGVAAFEDCLGLTSVTIGNSVTSIGEFAFEYCSDLTSITFSGDAPLVDGVAGSADSTVFDGDSGAVYYLPGTTGWDSTFGSWPTVELFAPPQIGGGIGIQSASFGFTIKGVSNQVVTIEASTNLVNWQPVWTNTLSGASTNFIDSQWTNFPNRFYRAARYTVGGTLTGLPTGDTVTLQANGSDSLTLSNNGTFTFPTALPNGQSYFVTVTVTVSGTGGETSIQTAIYQPVTANGSGTISGANVTNVAVQCTPVYTGNLDVDMYNAAVADGTANGGVPGVMPTENGGPVRVTASGPETPNSNTVAEIYAGSCKFTYTVGSYSCSSTTFPSGTRVIQFGGPLECGFGPYRY